MKKLNRRSFLREAGTGLLQTEGEIDNLPYKDPSNKTLPTHLGKTATGIGPYSGAWGEAEVRHLLRRTLFGATKGDVDFFKVKSVNNAVDYLLALPMEPPSPPLNNYGYNVNLADPDVPNGETWVNAPANPNLEFARRASFKAWWMGLIINQERNIREKMTLFLHNHFATETNTVQDSRYIYKHHAMLRANCLGNFKDLTKMVTIDPSMLRYLNGYANTKNAPDENYARELQELFTVGKDLAVHYSESDVKEAARILTGWRDNRTGISSYFDSTKHDTGNKTFSSFYNSKVITGQTGASGANEVDALLDMIFAQEEVSKYICRKIYRYFVYYLIDDTVEQNVILPLAELFRTNNYDLMPVISTLLKSEHFFDTLNRGCMIKQPMDHAGGLTRQFVMQFPPSSNVVQQYTHWTYIQQSGALLSQDLGDPPNVAGWPAYWQEPQYYELWINSDSLPKRNQLCDKLINPGYSRQSFTLVIDCIALADQFDNPDDPGALVSQIVELLYAVDISQVTKDSLKTSFLLTNLSSDHYWTDAWNAYKATPGDAMLKATVNLRLQGLIKYLVDQAEFQLC